MIIGYTAGVFDMFHIGHLKLLKNARERCDKLVVGVTTDELAKVNGKAPIIPFSERMEIVRSIKFVDVVVPQVDMDKISKCKEIGATLLFVGDDWKGTKIWNEYEKLAKKENIKIIYLPYTKGTSSTKIKEKIKIVS